MVEHNAQHLSIWTAFNDQVGPAAFDPQSAATQR